MSAIELLEKIQDEVKGKTDELAQTDEAIAKSLGTVYEMAKANDKSTEEIRGELTEYTGKLSELTDTVTKGFESQNELRQDIATLNDTITALKSQGNLLKVVTGEEAPDQDLQKSAMNFWMRHHLLVHGTEKGAPEFNVKSITDEKVTEYANIRAAVAKMFRADEAGRDVMLSPEMRKDLSTVTHDDMFFLPTEISSQVLRCFEDESTVVGLFDNVRMGGHRLVFPIEPTEGVYAEWACEIDCNNEDTDLQQWGSLELVVKDLRAKACITGTMARDSAIDLETRLGAIARRSFELKMTRDYFSSNPKGGMTGAFDAGNHVCVDSNKVGKISYMDLVKLAASYPARFLSGARWLWNCKTNAYVYTLTDADGRPFFDFRDGNILGIPVARQDQFPALYDETGTLIGGAKAIALANIREHYVLATREDFRASRNPYRKQNCNLIEWYFHQSVAGDVKCPNAFRALKVKEA